tara:strand:+ start:2991 stop:3743 length:753 start_codon:yes stop_codon:yes gene_type:complete
VKIGIAGFGYVGQAHYKALKDYYTVLVNDPAKEKYDDLRLCDAIIVCVATPQAKDGSCDMKNVYDVLNDTKDVPILIKSTISIEGWEYIKSLWQNVSFSPEFLRADSALDDFRKNKTILMGGDSVGFWQDIFLNAMGNINIFSADPKELIFVKYFRNSFLATKVAFFNEIYDLCQASNINYETVRELISIDERIGSSHTYISEERGYGGHCFPKDINAILKTANNLDNDLNILTTVKKYNNKIRKNLDKQ